VNLFQDLTPIITYLLDMKSYFVHILTNKKDNVLYVGVTNDLSRRLFEHKMRSNPQSFTARYSLSRLVYYEDTSSPDEAIRREKQLKKWRRQWKINLIESANPTWDDLSRRYSIDAETSSL